MYIEKIGRRSYIKDTSYSAKTALRAAGCKWDPDQRAWWTGKATMAEELLQRLQNNGSTRRDEAEGEATEVIGRATYKGRSYYLVWEGTTKRGPACKLSFRDGSKQFWADASLVRIDTRYRDKRSIRSLREYAEKAKSYGTEECRCYCHNERNAGAPGSILYDGCDRCGCEAC